MMVIFGGSKVAVGGGLFRLNLKQEKYDGRKNGTEEQHCLASPPTALTARPLGWAIQDSVFWLGPCPWRALKCHEANNDAAVLKEKHAYWGENCASLRTKKNTEALKHQSRR